LPEGITAMIFHVFRTGQEWHDDYDILWLGGSLRNRGEGRCQLREQEERSENTVEIRRLGYGPTVNAWVCCEENHGRKTVLSCFSQKKDW
jgi:hypothetical protein